MADINSIDLIQFRSVTRAEWDEISEKDRNTLYLIRDEEGYNMIALGSVILAEDTDAVFDQATGILSINGYKIDLRHGIRNTYDSIQRIDDYLYEVVYHQYFYIKMVKSIKKLAFR